MHFGDSEPPEPKKAVPGTPEWQAAFGEANDEDLPEDDEDLTEDDDNFDKHAPKGERNAATTTRAKIWKISNAMKRLCWVSNSSENALIPSSISSLRAALEG